jgi:hypothetical protein
MDGANIKTSQYGTLRIQNIRIRIHISVYELDPDIIRIRISSGSPKIQKQDLDPAPAPHQDKIQEMRSLKRSIGGPQTFTMEAQRLKIVADSHHLSGSASK